MGTRGADRDGHKGTDRDRDKKHNGEKNTPQTPPNEKVTPRETFEIAWYKQCQS